MTAKTSSFIMHLAFITAIVSLALAMLVGGCAHGSAAPPVRRECACWVPAEDGAGATQYLFDAACPDTTMPEWADLTNCTLSEVR